MGIFAIEKGAFAQVSAEDQQTVREVMGEIMTGLDREARDDNRRAYETLLRSGLRRVDVDSDNVANWRKTIEGLYPRLRTRPDIDAPMFDELIKLLAEYRRAHP
jgi:TRAP-type C4-dicarboxylate transport system substrate-binding protein